MISIITPVYNTSMDSIQKSWDSLLHQSDKYFEWIVVFDGFSKDINPKILNGDYIKVVELNNNYGPSVARNVGFQVSNGNIISYLDAGDEYSVDRVKHIKDIFRGFNNKILMDSYHIVQNGVDTFYNIHNIARQYSFRRLVTYQNITIPLSLSHTRDIFVKVGGFQRGIVCGEDGILIRRMLDNLTDDKACILTNFDGGTYYVSETGQSRTQRRFEMGGFAFDASHPEGTHGQYLDKDWYETFNSVKWFEMT